MDKYIYGGDTETCRGEPNSLQFYSEDCACDEIYFVNADNAFDTFLKWCGKRRRNVQHVVYVHHLGFDLVEFVWGHHAKLVSKGGDFHFRRAGWSISGVYGAPTFCRVTNGHDITVILVDSFSYFRESLDAGAKRVCPHIRKRRRPAGLGEKRFTKRDANFCDYAMRDAVIAFHMGKAIEATHRQYDLPQCVSIADMAANVFRRRYLTYTIPQPTREIIEASLLSYHGGKNNITVESGWYEGVDSIDIRSAYPEAMSEMPAFSNAKLYKRYRAEPRTKQVPDYGVYRVSGRVAECDWPVLFSHGFKPFGKAVGKDPLVTRFTDIWVQGFELNEAISSGEFTATAHIRGFYYDAEKDLVAPALRAFCLDQYEKKETAPNKVMRTMHKLIVNSISGKLIQTRKRNACAYTDVDAGVTTTAAELVAGGMCHPFIASAVTAKPRARLHRLEHHYEALHSATDGILTQKHVRVLASHKPHDIHPTRSKGLGSLAHESSGTTALLVRNKCYVQYAPKAGYSGTEKCETTPSKVFRGKHIFKYAKHGFQGSIRDLEKLVASGKRTYFVQRANTLKESLRRQLVPNDFVRKKMTLKVGPLPVFKKRRG